MVITDIVMPEMNGLDMHLELTREFLYAKVIAISGARREKNVLDVAKLLGARQTFQKPFSLPHLLGAVRYELEHWQDAEKVGQSLKRATGTPSLTGATRKP